VLLLMVPVLYFIPLHSLCLPCLQYIFIVLSLSCLFFDVLDDQLASEHMINLSNLI